MRGKCTFLLTSTSFVIAIVLWADNLYYGYHARWVDDVRHGSCDVGKLYAKLSSMFRRILKDIAIGGPPPEIKMLFTLLNSG
jgi:hypothetical protein